MLDALIQAWLPIVATAIAVFIASSLIHMLFKWHNRDYRPLANEDAVMDAMRAGAPTRGQYVMPHCMDMQKAKAPEMQAKYNAGPIAFITVMRNGMPNMGVLLGQWFLYLLLVATIAACVVLHVYGLDADPRRAGHLAGILSLLAYGAGSVQQGIWMGRPWGSVALDLLDAAIYAGATAGVFWWLWP